MAVVSVFTFNGENALLRLHMSILDPYVDKFIIVEANKTFSGNSKALYFARDQQFFKQWWKKIDYYAITDWDDTDIWELAINSPNTKGARHWKREFYIKESIHKALKRANLQDSDMVLLGDVDEILDPQAIYESNGPFKAKLRVYSYYLNNRSSEEFWGTLVAEYGDIKDQCLNHMRSDPKLYSKGDYLGWHFTSMGGLDEVRRKLNDSYTPESYNTFDVQQKLPERLKTGQDYLGRDFTFKLDESEWPEFLKENKDKFKNLVK